MSQVQKKKKHPQKMQFSDEQIRNQIEDEVRQIRLKDITPVQKQQLIGNLYNDRKNQKKKRQILEQDIPIKKQKEPQYKLEEDQEQGEIHQAKQVIEPLPEQFQEEFSIRDLGDHIRPITLTRNRIQNLLNSPRFQKLIKGCFVRYLNDKASANTYMIAQVIGVTEGPKQYLVGSIKTKLLLKLQQSQESIVTLSIQFITNKHPPGGLQIQKWLRSNRNKMPKDTELKEKKEEHDKLLNEQRSSEEIDNNILERARNIAYNSQEPKEDVGNLIQFMNRRLHHLEVKEVQFIDMRDATDVSQKEKKNIKDQKKKVEIEKIQTQEIIGKLKQIALLKKKNGEKKQNTKVASKAQKKYSWNFEDNKPDEINEKAKSKLAVLSTFQGHLGLKNSIISIHSAFEFPL